MGRLEFDANGFVDLDPLSEAEVERIEKRVVPLAMRVLNRARTSTRFRGTRVGLTGRYLIMRLLGMADRFEFDSYGNYHERGVVFHVFAHSTQAPPKPDTVYAIPIERALEMQEWPDLCLFVNVDGYKGDCYVKRGKLVGWLSFAELRKLPRTRTEEIINNKDGTIEYGPTTVAYKVEYSELHPGLPEQLVTQETSELALLEVNRG